MNFRSDEKDEYTAIFEEERRNVSSTEYGDVSLYRLNQLFQAGSISAAEHVFLVEKLFPPAQRISLFAIASLVVSILAWILFLKYSFGAKEYSLLSGEGRILALTILSPISILLAFVAYKEFNIDERVKGKEFAAAGFVLAMLYFITLVIPYWLIFK